MAKLNGGFMRRILRLFRGGRGSGRWAAGCRTDPRRVDRVPTTLGDKTKMYYLVVKQFMRTLKNLDAIMGKAQAYADARKFDVNNFCGERPRPGHAAVHGADPDRL